MELANVPLESVADGLVTWKMTKTMQANPQKWHFEFVQHEFMFVVQAERAGGSYATVTNTLLALERTFSNTVYWHVCLFFHHRSIHKGRYLAVFATLPYYVSRD